MRKSLKPAMAIKHVRLAPIIAINFAYKKKSKRISKMRYVF